ncbi:MAG TPA: hypothetical protein VGH44_04075 [Candidatus Saccharimonadia bacterium]|jgi:hypothetical protein
MPSHTITIAILLVLTVVVLSYLTDPFNRFSIIRLPFKLKLTQAAHTFVNNNHRLKIRQLLPYRAFAITKAGIHILHTRYVSSPRSSGQTVSEIIADIHVRRFDPSKLLVISGDHFNGLFVRNLGVFYYPLLDTATPLNTNAVDWGNRQTSYLQTVAYALGVYAKHPVPSTTIVPTGPLTATCVNFYAYPSDTVYGILFALAALLGQESANPYLAPSAQRLPLQTKPGAKFLLKTYHSTLITLYDHYRKTVLDEATGLIKTSVHLSGAKDITRRTSAFYDNVILWKTIQLMQELGLQDPNPQFLTDLKQRILNRFWLEDKGYFLEDLSPAGLRDQYYSSDWLVVLFTGFLDTANPAERPYFERSIEYIQRHKIDQPFAIKYQHETRANRQFLPVRLAVASYGGDAIWSFWGMEYIKTLALLYRSTGQESYIQTATYHLQKYREKIQEYGGFPEIYDAQGHMLQTPFYRSIRQTGWVVGFEQASGLVEALTKNQPPKPL